MENTTFAKLSAQDFDNIRFFDANKLEIVFHPESTQWYQPEARDSIAICNAITSLMLGQYAVQAPGVWMSKTWEEAKLGMDDDNLGYLMGYAVRKLLEEKVITYRKAAELEDTGLYRGAWDILNAFVRKVEHVEADAMEADYLTHNRNAWRTVHSLERIKRARDLGLNIRLTWFDRMEPYFTGEHGFRVKVGLFNLGKIDDLRTMVNLQIADAVAGKSLYKEGKRADAAKAKAAEEGIELTVKAVKAFAGLKDVSYEAKDLIGKTVALFTAGGSPLNRMVGVTENENDTTRNLVSIDVLRRTVSKQGLVVDVVDGDAPEKKGKAGRKPRFTNDPVNVS